MPPREKPQPVSPVANREKFEAIRDEFHRIRAWDPATGVPTRSKLGELNLSDVAEGLERDRSLEMKQ